MKSETKALVDRANQLRDVLKEKDAEGRRYWDRLRELGQAQKNAGSPQELWDAYRAYGAYYNQNPPNVGEIAEDWRQAVREAMRALAADAGLLETGDE